MLALLLMIHISLCIILQISVYHRKDMDGARLMALVWLVPVWGVLCFVVMRYQKRPSKATQTKDIGVEKLKIEDNILRSIFVDENDISSQVVPLGEALAINDAQMRRKLMLDILYENPEAYIEQLQEASSNDDSEVSHYAVTALTELQKNYERQFQLLNKSMEKEPENMEYINSYIELSEKYLNSGLVTGETSRSQLYRYEQILERKMGLGGKDYLTFEKRIAVCMQLRRYENANSLICEMTDRWPQREKGYLLQIEYYAAMKDRKGIDSTLQALQDKDVYLSAKGRGVVDFWKARKEGN